MYVQGESLKTNANLSTDWFSKLPDHQLGRISVLFYLLFFGPFACLAWAYALYKNFSVKLLLIGILGLIFIFYEGTALRTNFAVLFISLTLLFAAALALGRYQESMQKKAADKLRKLATEKNPHHTDSDILYKFTAKYSGDYTKYPYPCVALLAGTGSALHIQSIYRQPSIGFSIPIKSIRDFGLFTPSLPYIMNLNVAGILANAATRAQVGSSAYITFMDDLGILQKVAFKEFKDIKAEEFIQRIHNVLAKTRAIETENISVIPG